MNMQFRRARAFTLLELLAVLAIIFLLTAIRLPVLSQTKIRSLDAVDFQNNKQLMAAANMYAADHNDFLPGCGWGTASDSWAYAKNIPGTYSGQINSLRHGQLFPYVKKEPVFMCPLDKPNNRFYQRLILITSYTWNGAVCGYGNLATANAPDSYKLAQFKPTAILQWEADDSTPFYFNDASSFPDEGVSGRHGNRVTAGLVSGGTQPIELKRWFSSSYAGARGQRGAGIPAGQLPNQLWCNPGSHRGLQN